MTEKINSNHKDWFSKISLSLLTFICIAAMTSTFGIFRSQLVLADDMEKALQPIKTQLAQQAETNEKITQSIEDLGVAIKEGNIRYIEDQIIELEVTATERALTPTETQRLLRYKADLERIKK